MTALLTYAGTLQTVTCWCGIGFAVPSTLRDQAFNHGTTIYCPLGHTCTWAETENDRLRAELETANRTAIRERNWRETAEAQVESERRSKAAIRGHLTRMRNKIANGICPVAGCRRHFDNVQSHLTTKHAGWLEAHDIEIASLG